MRAKRLPIPESVIPPIGASTDPQAAVQWAESIGNQNLRDRQIEAVVVTWLQTDANRATAWLANSSLSAETKARLLLLK